MRSSLRHQGRGLAVINAITLDDAESIGASVVVIDFDGETEHERWARWARTWMPATLRG